MGIDLIVLPLFVCGDLITNILYIIFNWNLYANNSLKVFSIIFIYLHILMVVVLQFKAKRRYLYVIDVFLIWTRI
jgi:hypothetical protein